SVDHPDLQGRLPIFGPRRAAYCGVVKRFLILILTGACVIAPTAEAAKKKHTCRSGSTIYKHNGVRVFEDGGFNGAWFACGPRSRRPAPLYSSEAGYGQLSVFGREGDK